jgi:hypothetical protein
MTPDLISALSGSGATGLILYVLARKGLVSSKVFDDYKRDQEKSVDSATQLTQSAITTLEKTTEIRLASGERQFKEIKDTMQEYNRALIDLTGSVNKLIGRHEVLMEHVEREHGNGEDKR